MAQLVEFMAKVDDIVDEICVRIKLVLLNEWQTLDAVRI